MTIQISFADYLLHRDAPDADLVVRGAAAVQNNRGTVTLTETELATWRADGPRVRANIDAWRANLARWRYEHRQVGPDVPSVGPDVPGGGAI